MTSYTKIFFTAVVSGILFTSSLSAFMTKEKQQAMTTTQAVERLKAGNKRFLSGTGVQYNYLKDVKISSGGQHPFAVVIECIDSRVPAELVFDQTIGDIFNARVAGPVINDDILGSVEYSTKVVGSKLILVLGHTDCGAVKGAIGGVKLGNLTGLLNQIKPAIKDVPKNIEPRNDHNKTFVKAVAYENVKRMVKQIRSQSPIIKGLEEEQKIIIVGAVYDVNTGKVNFLE